MIYLNDERMFEYLKASSLYRTKTLLLFINNKRMHLKGMMIVMREQYTSELKRIKIHIF
jgi:hypothetical protein